MMWRKAIERRYVSHGNTPFYCTFSACLHGLCRVDFYFAGGFIENVEQIF